MIEFKDAENANDYIQAKSQDYAKATAEREYLDEQIKIIEATIMNTIDGAEHTKKAFARSHESYKEKVEKRKEQRLKEIYYRTKIAAAQAKIDLWRSYNKTQSMGA